MSWWEPLPTFSTSDVSGIGKECWRNGPWSFDKHLLVLKALKGIGKVVEKDFRLTAFWVQMHNLPLACINKEVGFFLREMVGQVIEINVRPNDNCWENCYQFISISMSQNPSVEV